MTLGDKNLGLKMNDKIIAVSIDRVKPCFDVFTDLGTSEELPVLLDTVIKKKIK